MLSFSQKCLFKSCRSNIENEPWTPIQKSECLKIDCDDLNKILVKFEKVYGPNQHIKLHTKKINDSQINCDKN